jgi:hypothetical protein
MSKKRSRYVEVEPRTWILIKPEHDEKERIARYFRNRQAAFRAEGIRNYKPKTKEDII